MIMTVEEKLVEKIISYFKQEDYLNYTPYMVEQDILSMINYYKENIEEQLVEKLRKIEMSPKEVALNYIDDCISHLEDCREDIENISEDLPY